MADVTVMPNALPLPLSVPISERPASNVLPLAMTRKLGTSSGTPINPDVPVDPKPPLEYALAMPNVAACFAVSAAMAVNVTRHGSINNHGALIASDLRARYTQSITVAQRFAVRTKQLVTLANCNYVLSGLTYQIASSKRVSARALILLSSEQRVAVSASIGYSRCSIAHSAAALHYQQCMTATLQSTIEYVTAKSANNAGQHLEQDAKIKISKAVPVPCRYYPIPELPPIKPPNVCRIRPPSSQLPLRMARQRRGLLSSHLPLPLTCWHDDPPLFIPSLRTYIMHNIITANIGGISVDPLGFNIKTDMDSYYWSGGVSISPDDYAKIKSKLDVSMGQEPMINVAISDLSFSIIAENHSRTRKFGNQTHSLDGRSITARLGADYARANDRLFDQANYASQIVNEQLANLPFTASFEIEDWLIPASTYAVSNKTPIAVIADIAEAAGGFVESHPTDATMSIKKRWKINAWELASATPDVTIPADVIKSATDKTVKNTRYNTVLLVGNVGHEVYRATQGRDVAAPTLSNALFTAREVTVPKGSAVLSDSGTHSIQTLDLIFDDSIPLAGLGQIWQVNDTDGAWRGVITGVALDCRIESDAPEIGQTITIDRYMDN